MRQMDRYPFIFAIVLFLLAWMLGLPVRRNRRRSTTSAAR